MSRVRLKRKISIDSDSLIKLGKSVWNLKNDKKNKDLSFAVKSLEEIRQEKKRKNLTQNLPTTALSTCKSFEHVIDSQIRTQPKLIMISPKDTKIDQKLQTFTSINPVIQSPAKSLLEPDPKLVQQNSQQDNKKTKEINPAFVPQARPTRLAGVRQLRSSHQPGNDQSRKELMPQASDFFVKKGVIKIKRINPKLQSLPETEIEGDSKKKNPVTNPLDLKNIDNLKTGGSLDISIETREISQKHSIDIKKTRDHPGKLHGSCTAEMDAFSISKHSQNLRTSENFSESMQFSASEELNVQDSSDIHNQTGVQNSIDDQDFVHVESHHLEPKSKMDEKSLLSPDIKRKYNSFSDGVDFSELDDSNNKPSETMSVYDDDEFLREIEQVINS